MIKFKILIIDDEPSNIETFANCLEKEDYNILVALNGNEGYNIACKHLPDLIITDWDMPELSGIETIKLLKNNTLTKKIPIIMATGKMIKSEDLKTALEAGANDYIRKPIDKIELIARVNSMILFVQTMNKNYELEAQITSEKEQTLLREIEKNRTELASKTIKLIKNSEFNEYLINKLHKINQIPTENYKQISELIKEFKKQNLSMNFKEFEVTFNNVHPNFYTNLQKDFPQLSLADRKMCALLRLNLSSKEISALTYHSMETIKKSRFRLRKKLNLDSDDNISSFLQKY